MTGIPVLSEQYNFVWDTLHFLDHISHGAFFETFFENPIPQSFCFLKTDILQSYQIFVLHISLENADLIVFQVKTLC